MELLFFFLIILSIVLAISPLIIIHKLNKIIQLLKRNDDPNNYENNQDNDFQTFF